MKKMLCLVLMLSAVQVYAKEENCCNPKANPRSEGACVPASKQGCASGEYLVWNCDRCKKAIAEYQKCRDSNLRYCDFRDTLIKSDAIEVYQR